MPQDFQIIFLALCGSIILLSLVLFILYSISRYRKAQSLHVEKLLKSKLEVRDETLKFVAEELHDDTGQLLSLSKIHAHQLAESHPEDKNATEILGLISDSLDKIRNLSHVLKTDGSAELGIIDILKNEKRKIDSLGSHKVEIKSSNDVGFSIENERLSVVHRIIQEAVNNILKHANAKKIIFDVYQKNKIRHITVSDDGKGYKLFHEKPEGIGIKNMKERAELIGAKLLLNSKEGRGSSVEIILD